MSRFEYRDEHNQILRLAPLDREWPDQAPAVWIEASDSGFYGASVKVPLDRIEEVIAGLRDIARQASGQPAPQPLTVHIEMGNENALKAAIRTIVQRGPGEAGA